MKPTFIDVLKKASLAFSICIFSNQIIAQNVGVNATGVKADVSAMLDISATNKGLLIPRVALQNVNDDETILSPLNSLLVFNTNATMGGGEGTGYYYNTGSADIPIWIKLSDNNSAASWLIGGNSNLTDLSFMGTTDDADVVFKRNSEEVMQFYTGGAVVFTGNPVTGKTPVSGSGARMMWMPERAAFRAGTPSVQGWDHENIGKFSFATGLENKAIGYGTAAWGVQNTAMGDYATAFGVGSQALGISATSMGSVTIAKGDNSVAMGEGAIVNALGGVGIGMYPKDNPADSKIAACSDVVFQIGVGTSPFVRKDALWVTRGGNLHVTGGVIANQPVMCASDLRLKTDIKPLESVLENINNIQPISYYFKDKETYSSNHQIGFSAQEIEQQFPELTARNEKGFLSVNYGQMAAVAIQAIKEQQLQIETLKKENKDQKDINNQLLQRLEKLEAAAKK